jgi:hypothetical protein
VVAINRAAIQRLRDKLSTLGDGETEQVKPWLLTPEQKRQWWIGELPRLIIDAFGPDDPRANRAHLDTLSQEQLHRLYLDCVHSSIETWKATNPADLEAFRNLSVEEKVRVLRDQRGQPR